MAPTTSVVVFSYGAVAADLLALVAELGARPVALVIPSNRGEGTVAPGQDAAAAAGVPVLVQPSSRESPAFAEQLRRLTPDVLVVWHYSQLLTVPMLAVPRRGAVNLHGGLLPDYRGPHVLQWAIINGERETGVTLHYLDDAFDTGPLIDERRIPIGADDDAATLSEKLRVAGVSLLRAHWEAIVTGSVTARPQPEGGRYWPARTAEDGRIDWQTSAEQIDRLARALVAPWPGAFFEVEGQRVVIDRALPTTGASGATPGTVLEVHSNEVVVAAGSDSAVTLSDFHIDGVSVAAAELGLAPGDFLGGKL